MTRMIHAAAAAMSALCLASAIPAAAQHRTIVTARIAHRDLDLSTPAGRATLDSRVKDAARLACGAPVSPVDQLHARDCTDEILRNATVKIDAMVGRRDVQLASLR